MWILFNLCTLALNAYNVACFEKLGRRGWMMISFVGLLLSIFNTVNAVAAIV